MIAERDRDPARIRDRVVEPPTRFEWLVIGCIGLILALATRYVGSGIDWEIFAGAADGRMTSEYGLGYYYPYWLLPIFDVYDTVGIVGQLAWSMTNVAGLWFAARVFGARPAVVLAAFGALMAFYTGTITGVALGALAGVRWAATERRWVVAGGLTLLSVAKPQWGIPLTLVVLVQARPRLLDLLRLAVVPVPVALASFAVYGWWPGEILQRAADNPPVGNGSLWIFVGPAALLLWLPVVLPMEPTRRLALVAAASMMGVPYVQQYDFAVLWIMATDGLGLLSYLHGPVFHFFGERVVRGVLLGPTLWAYALLVRQPLESWRRQRRRAPGGPAEQPA